MYRIEKFPNFQISKFPNFQIFIALFLLSFQTFGQDNFPKLRNKLDRVFAKVDKSQIPFGTLEENSFGFMNLWQMKPSTFTFGDTLNSKDHTVFRAAYSTLETGKINNTYNLLPIDSLNVRSRRYRQQHPDQNPIVLLHAGYSYFCLCLCLHKHSTSTSKVH